MTFEEVLARCLAIHDAKAHDYGDEKEGSFANIRRSERIGIPAWIGAFIRMQDKFNRLETLIPLERRGEGPRVAESLDDTLFDLINYAAIILSLRSEVTS